VPARPSVARSAGLLPAVRRPPPSPPVSVQPVRPSGPTVTATATATAAGPPTGSVPPRPDGTGTPPVTIAAASSWSSPRPPPRPSISMPKSSRWLQAVLASPAGFLPAEDADAGRRSPAPTRSAVGLPAPLRCGVGRSSSRPAGPRTGRHAGGGFRGGWPGRPGRVPPASCRRARPAPPPCDFGGARGPGQRGGAAARPDS